MGFRELHHIVLDKGKVMIANLFMEDRLWKSMDVENLSPEIKLPVMDVHSLIEFCNEDDVSQTPKIHRLVFRRYHIDAKRKFARYTFEGISH